MWSFCLCLFPSKSEQKQRHPTEVRCLYGDFGQNLGSYMQISVKIQSKKEDTQHKTECLYANLGQFYLLFQLKGAPQFLQLVSSELTILPQE